MIKSINTKLSRPLLLLISFAMLFFITACGGSKDESTTTSGYSIAITSTVTSLAAGDSSIITATVTDGAGTPVKGETVKFSIITNNSGATSTTLNGGQTDANGQAIATYTAGANSPTKSVQDMIKASTSGATAVATITRTSSSSAGFKISLTTTASSFAAGESAILTATVTDSLNNPVSGQAVTFTLLTDNSGASLTTLSLGVTDNSGQAQAIYKAGANSPTTSVQDIVQAGVTGASVNGIFTRTSSSTSLTGYKMTLIADATSLSAGNSTIIRATVTQGSGNAVSGQTVTFSILPNNSGASISPLNGGLTDATGVATATYTAGLNNPTASVQDIVQASLTGATGAVIITRTSGSGTSTGLLLALTAEKISLAAGESTIITAKVTRGGGAVQGQIVTISFVSNSSHADLVILSGTTDVNGEATALYTAGSFTGATVQDIVQASITGSTKAIIITKTGSSAGATASSIYLSASPPSVKSDGSTTSTITVTALNASNAALSGIEVTMSSVGDDHGILSAATVTTPGQVTFSCGPNKANRTATVTGTSGSVSAQIPVRIVGTTVTLTAGTSSISAPPSATSTTLTVTVKDAGNNPISNAVVTLSQLPTGGIGSGSVTLGATSGTTNGSGVFTTTATGVTQGSVTITADYLGTASTTIISVTATGNTFAITAPVTDPAATKLSDTLTVTVNVPSPITSVTFATTIGVWDGGLSKVVVKSGLIPPTTVSATLTTSNIGIANIQAYATATPAISDTLTVAMSSGASAAKIFLQASPTVVPTSVGTTTGSSTLTATVYDSANNPLGGQPVLFEIVEGSGTSGGETISPVVAITATAASGGLSVGQARATFNSGSMPSSGTGVKIRVSVVDIPISVHTGSGATPPSPGSGNDAAIVIGGVAGSIAFGQDSKAAEDSTKANYEYKMSVLVADANGNPVSGAVVNLGIWPIAWATGVGCFPDPDGWTFNPISLLYDLACAKCGTFWNEDRNENLILDSTPAPQEDGARCYYANATKCSGGGWLGGGKTDYLITPTNSVGGTVPASVITDTNGVAGFKVTYPKTSAAWIWDRIRATTIVQGSETRAEIILYLRIVIGEEVICAESPFKF